MPELVMAKKRTGRPSKGRNDVTVKVDIDIARKAKGIASLTGRSVAEYLTEVLGPIVERDLKRAAGKSPDGDRPR